MGDIFALLLLLCTSSFFLSSHGVSHGDLDGISFVPIFILNYFYFVCLLLFFLIFSIFFPLFLLQLFVRFGISLFARAVIKIKNLIAYLKFCLTFNGT